MDIKKLTADESRNYMRSLAISKEDIKNLPNNEAFYRQDGDLCIATIGARFVFDEWGDYLPEDTLLFPMTPEVISIHNHLVDIEDIQETIRESGLDYLTLTELRELMSTFLCLGLQEGYYSPHHHQLGKR